MAPRKASALARIRSADGQSTHCVRRDRHTRFAGTLCCIPLKPGHCGSSQEIRDWLMPDQPAENRESDGRAITPPESRSFRLSSPDDSNSGGPTKLAQSLLPDAPGSIPVRSLRTEEFGGQLKVRLQTRNSALREFHLRAANSARASSEAQYRGNGLQIQGVEEIQGSPSKVQRIARLEHPRSTE